MDLKNTKTIYAVVGPTCTFKSDLAIDLAKKYPFEIISADSRLVYKDMNIGTSKPALEERKNVPHYMIDLIEPGTDYSVSLYKKESSEKVVDIFSRNKIPLFVGGTGLYLNSILLGLSIPEVKPDTSFRRQLKQFTQEELYKNLKELDPKACEIIHKNDNFRTIRALEVIYKTNKLFSKLKTIKELPFDVTWVGFKYENKELHIEKIKNRTENFCRSGFLDEVKELISRYGVLDLFKNTIGYKEAIDCLTNKITKDQMLEKITLHTRQFAKRQMTWFRANKKISWIRLDELNYEDVLSKLFDLIEEGSLAKTSMVSMS